MADSEDWGPVIGFVAFRRCACRIHPIALMHPATERACGDCGEPATAPATREEWEAQRG